MKIPKIPTDLKNLGFGNYSELDGDYGRGYAYNKGDLKILDLSGSYFMVSVASDWYTYIVSKSLSIEEIKLLIKIINK